VAKVINCECGFVVRGDSDDELVQNAKAHIGDQHPEMAGTVSDEDLLGMAEET
jgi:predicted small metal-binding protein